MRKILSILAILAISVSFSFAQSNATAAAEEQSADGPIMTFQSTEVNYGEIEQGADPLRVFEFQNTGNEPLIIKHAKGSCGCTVPSYPKEPILPGEAAKIEVRYDTKRIGKFTKSVTLTTNEAVEKRVLRIKGVVNKKAEAPAGVPVGQPSILAPSKSN